MSSLLSSKPLPRISDLAGTTMSKCMFDADPTFTLYTFMIGFILPAFLIIIFYVRVRIFKGCVENLERKIPVPGNMGDSKIF